MASDQKLLIGSQEWCNFPTLGIPAIKARVDSGAKTSAIHAFNISPFRRNNEAWVSFEVHPLQNNRRTAVRCESRVVDRRKIKNTSGVSESRYVIRVPMRFGEQEWDVEISLTNRDSMGYRFLLGRQAMLGRVVVDPELKFSMGGLSAAQLSEIYYEPERVQSGLRIGLLATNENLYSNRRLMEAAWQRGHDVRFLNIAQCYMKLHATDPEIYYRGGAGQSDLDGVITRIRPSMTYYGCAITRQFESMGVKTINSSEAITQSRDKLLSYQILIKHGIEIPTTGFGNSPIDTNALIDIVDGAPLIVKLLEGTQGRGVVLAETRKAAESLINAFKTLKANLLVQQFVKEANGKDLRCFVIDGKVVASIERTAAPGEFRANIHRGATAAVVRITAAERALAVKAAKTLGLRIAGVDLIRSKNGPLLLEVNSSPGLEGIEAATGKDIATMVITSMEKALRWKRPVSSSE